MVHVNVKRGAQQSGADPFTFIVETSTDGAGWKTQYVVDIAACHNVGAAQSEAENIARIMGEAWAYAGVEWRGTSCGNSL